jgi:AraC-like DNA-binding protein
LSDAQLVLKLKMERAAELLKQSDASIAAIGRSLGYSDNSSFYHAFTRYYGKTPRAF